MKLTIAALAALFIVAGCTSPEANRVRGGGPGADMGNRGDVVRMHAGAEPYYETPQLIGARAPSSDGGTRPANR